MRQMLTNKELFSCKLSYLRAFLERTDYPWELLPRLGEYLQTLIHHPPEDFIQFAPGVWVGREVRIAATATIEGPAVLGHGTVLRPGAYLRGNVLTGEGCVIGNSTELKHCILLSHVQVPHYNYVGDSILGEHAHLGAGAICSNLKADGKAVVIHGEKEHETGLRKVGAILGDGANVGCGCVLNPGTVIGKNTVVYPLIALRGVYPADAIVKTPTTAVPRKEEP